MLSQKTRYALKALLELSALPAGTTLSSSAISARRNIPVKFLESILVELKRGGLVFGRRGRSGGYQLGRRAEDISFGGVVRLMEGPLALLPCVSVTQYRRCVDCPDVQSCELRKLFRVLHDSTVTILDGWTLADARGSTGPPAMRIGTSALKEAGRRLNVEESSSGRSARRAGSRQKRGRTAKP